MLGKLPVPGRPANLYYSTARTSALAVGAGGGCLDIFSLIFHFSSFSLSLGDDPIQTEILSQRAIKPKQPIGLSIYSTAQVNKLVLPPWMSCSHGMLA